MNEQPLSTDGPGAYGAAEDTLGISYGIPGDQSEAGPDRAVTLCASEPEFHAFLMRHNRGAVALIGRDPNQLMPLVYLYSPETWTLPLVVTAAPAVANRFAVPPYAPSPYAPVLVKFVNGQATRYFQGNLLDPASVTTFVESLSGWRPTYGGVVTR